MDTERIPLKLLMVAVVIVVAVELLAWVVKLSFPWPAIAIVGVSRLLEAAAMLVLAAQWGRGGLASVGLQGGSLKRGLQRGLLWSMALALMAVLGIVVLSQIGLAPLAWLGGELPEWPLPLLRFLIVAGLVGPVTEEILFRGIFFGYFRRWGIWLAVTASTLLFVLAHLHTIRLPLTQLIGGIVFAGTYARERSLMVPICIHVIGNLMLFAISGLA